MSVTGPNAKSLTSANAKSVARQQGFALLAAMVALMWVIELINSVDSYKLDQDGLYPHNVDRIWGIFTTPFLHASWSHLIGNTIPFVFMGALIALEGARRLAAVTLIVIVLGGLGTWLLSPAGVPVVGASGVVFGYATYLLTRGFFNHSLTQILAGVVVVAVFGSALLASLVPHGNVSWQGHLCGGIAGVIAAWLLSRDRSQVAANPGAPGRALTR
ncbi:MAG TPA: rhomboid family intramembrane serine protease [Solirubrobacteraceae bacterium]|jgi:membrane associated rhomboid family serine protease|nr:rhomboid family intramembrane serine protease [Solirubrobacteraceae bacterium]